MARTEALAPVKVKFVRTGYTLRNKVSTAGEVLYFDPNLWGTTPFLTEEQQMQTYGKVFYVQTDEPVNVGPKAEAKWQPVTEPRDQTSTPLPGNMDTELLQTEVGGGATSFTPRGDVRPISEIPDEAALHGTVADDDEESEDEEKTEQPKRIKLKRKVKGKSSLKPKGKRAKATPLP